MTSFIYRGPLPPDSPLFFGRERALQRLLRLCRGEVQAYAIIYGGRQMGKTSLALRLAAQLPPDTLACRVDFQEMPGSGASQVYGHLARRVGEAVALNAAHVNEADRAALLGVADMVEDAPSLNSFLCQALSRGWIRRFVLLLEELGALPPATRHNLANVLRALFSGRFDPARRPLAKLVVVITGSIELYDLAATEVSTLHNICDAFYLSDLSDADTVSLMGKGLATAEAPETWAREIYAWTHGHAYLTQRLGALLADRCDGGGTLAPGCVAASVASLLRGDALLRHLRRALHEQALLDAARSLLEEHPRFSRLDENLARLELLGLAAERDGHWAVRNRLLENALQEW
jgi:hypothetical protein